MRVTSAACLGIASALCGLVFPAPADAQFYAQYQNEITNPVDHFGTDAHLYIGESTMSKDGSTVAFYGKNTDTGLYRLYRIGPHDGGVPISVAMPPNPDKPSEAIRLFSLTMSENGGEIYFASVWYQHRIYRWDGSGSVIEVLNLADYDYLTTPSSTSGPKVQATASGQWVYFQEDRDDLWRVSIYGGAPELVIDDTTVIRADGTAGWAVGDYDISDDGSEVAFILTGYRDAGGSKIVRYEVFFGSGVSYTQLTDDTIWDTHPRISGNGEVITYRSGDSGWYSVKPN